MKLSVKLRDGTPVILRPLVPEDRAALAEAFRRASSETRYQRFWTHTGEMIGGKMLDKILDQDPGLHATWAVLDPQRDFPPIGGASWWRDQENPLEAEISAIILDEDHRRGIGTLLLAVMWLSAYRAGVRELVGHTLVENRQATNWLRECGGTGSWDGYKLTFRWDLHDLDKLPSTPRTGELVTWLAELAPGILKTE
ncbi:MAG: GNAT family N-acetyltransferase [Luteolibacter sp.]